MNIITVYEELCRMEIFTLMWFIIFVIASISMFCYILNKISKLEETLNNRKYLDDECIRTLVDTYSKQNELSSRERKIYKHGLLDGIQFKKGGTWKPSDAQMGILWDVLCMLNHEHYKNAETVEVLFQDLKKLREE